MTADTLEIRPWPDPVIDSLGHDPRSSYVEQFWLGILGPSTTWLLRHFAAGLEENPAGFEMDLPAVAKQLGLGDKQGRHSPFMRSLARCTAMRPSSSSTKPPPTSTARPKRASHTPSRS